MLSHFGEMLLHGRESLEHVMKALPAHLNLRKFQRSRFEAVGGFAADIADFHAQLFRGAGRDSSFRKSTIRFVFVPFLLFLTPQQFEVLVNL